MLLRSMAFCALVSFGLAAPCLAQQTAPSHKVAKFKTPPANKPLPPIPPVPLPDEIEPPPPLKRLPPSLVDGLPTPPPSNLTPPLPTPVIGGGSATNNGSFPPTDATADIGPLYTEMWGDDEVVEAGSIGSGWSMHGWVNGGGTLNSRQPASRFNGPVTFNDRYEGQGNQTYVYLEKQVLGCAYGLDFGGRADVLYGSDYIFTQAVGLELRPNGEEHWNSHRLYGLSLPQFYAEVGTGYASVKAGHFYSPLGYECVAAPCNFFYSHSYAFQYGRPITNTGVIGSTRTDDGMTLSAGVVNGWNRFDGVLDREAYVGGFCYEPCDGCFTLSAAFITGNEETPAEQVDRRTAFNVWMQTPLSCRLTWTSELTSGWQASALEAGVTSEWYGIGQYFFYTLNDCWRLGVRGEWFRDDDGFRVQGLRPGNNLNANEAAGSFYAITAGLNWQPCENVLVRPEVRFDWFDGTTFPVNSRPFADGTRDSQVLFALDAVVMF